MTVLHPTAAPPLTLPQPPELPTRNPLGHLFAFRDDPLELLMRARQTCGDVVRVRIGPTTAYCLFDPDHVKQVLVDRQQHYSKQTRGYAALRLLLGQGLVTSEGSFWRRQRRIAQPAFHKRRLAKLANAMTDAATDLAASWQPLAAAEQPVDVASEMMRVTLRIAGETLFSVDLSDDSDDVGLAVTDLLQYFNLLFRSAVPFAQYVPTPTMFRGRRAIKRLDDLVYSIIERRRASDDRGTDLLGMFMDAVDEETGESMSDGQLRDEVLTMLTAGHETTANALSWTLYLLSKHPEVARRVEQELDAALPNGRVSVEHIRALPYTDQVLCEAMRLYPPVWALARRVEQDDELGGYRINAGSFVLLSPYAIHRHPEHWDNPEGFDPDRFAPQQRSDRARGGSRHAYLPFAMGPRKCIGDHFAKMEALIILATLLSRYRVQLVPGQQIEPEPSVTLRPKHGMRMTLSAR